MNVFTEHRFVRNQEQIYTTRNLDLDFWKRYLSEFDGVRIVGRVREMRQKGEINADMLIEHPAIEFVELPFYDGLLGYLRNCASVRRAVMKAQRKDGAILLRIPGQLGWLARCACRRSGRGYGVEVIGDPEAAFRPELYGWILGKPMQWLWRRRMKIMCKEAVGAAYVTEEQLQAKYPPNPEAVTASYSSLTQAPVVDVPRFKAGDWFAEEPLRIVSTGGLVKYKGFDVLLEAVSTIKRVVTPEIRLTVVGGGRERSRLESICDELGIAREVVFRGQCQQREVYRELRSADMFVLASYQEGLPRSVIEAMAHGLPCVATDVGGTDELLSKSMLAPAGDARALAKKMSMVIEDPTVRLYQARRNYSIGNKFSGEELSGRRKEFYSKLSQAIRR